MHEAGVDICFLVVIFVVCVCLVDKNRPLQQVVLEEYGADLHVALRSRRDELLYLRKLTEMLFPYVMPPKATDCRCRTRIHLFLYKDLPLTLGNDPNP